ncbi:zinc metalloprotease [Thalassobellus suaedae]|uniref:Zinc metalloprotease n=1 Tax=Thalassobellus suaedae TaxID=3074124 RepID=A0ABY9XRX2_9FLAO|nr:zinc metalloprotease [Flavobacteriaceae bacterium HL-DH14]
MKKLILAFAALSFVLTSCSNNENDITSEQSKIDMSDFYVYTNADVDETSKLTATKSPLKSCYTMVNLNRLLKENPGLEKKMYDIEYFTRQFIAGKKPTGTPGGGPGGGTTDPIVDTDGDGTPDSSDLCPNESGPSYNSGCPDNINDYTLTIPVVINIIEKSLGQITDAQIDSQIAILNIDFDNRNLNKPDVLETFNGLDADFDIKFTKHIVNRVTSNKKNWGTRDAMKFSSQGGIDATDPSTYLNIWVCEIGRGILGYAQFPGGPEATDGVVIGPDYFGETGGNYGHGRTATHEIGHWLNLRHIWGDGGCSVDDFVTDTPLSDGPNYGCPGETINCGTVDMTMNYMDYVYDDCMYMFTHGQKDRSRSLFTIGGYRYSFVD